MPKHDPYVANAIEKQCSKCGTLKPIAEFGIRRNRPIGRVSQCKDCALAAELERYSEKASEINRRRRDERAKNPELIRSKERAYRKRYSYIYVQRSLDYRRRNLQKVTARVSIQRQSESARTKRRARDTANRKQINVQARQWRKQHRAKVRADNFERKKRQRRQAPSWVDWTELNMIYDNCPPDMQVDHIVPLKGRTIDGYDINGLHVPWNLQYLSGSDNSRKRNKMRLADHLLCEKT